jgi:hypothetical protein
MTTLKELVVVPIRQAMKAEGIDFHAYDSLSDSLTQIPNLTHVVSSRILSITCFNLTKFSKMFNNCNSY